MCTVVQMLTLTQYIKYTIALVVAEGSQEAGLYYSVCDLGTDISVTICNDEFRLDKLVSILNNIKI